MLIVGCFLISPPGFPDRHQSAKAAQQQRAHGDGATAGVLRQKLQRRRADRRADEISQTDGGFVDAAMFALGVARIH